MSMGHAHKLVSYKPEPIVQLVPDGHGWVKQQYPSADQTADYIPPELRFFVCTGSFLRAFAPGVSGYAEIKGYGPNELGYQVGICRDGRLEDIKPVVL
jgi:hypothetical protein